MNSIERIYEEFEDLKERTKLYQYSIYKTTDGYTINNVLNIKNYDDSLFAKNSNRFIFETVQGGKWYYLDGRTDTPQYLGKRLNKVMFIQQANKKKLILWQLDKFTEFYVDSYRHQDLIVQEENKIRLCHAFNPSKRICNQFAKSTIMSYVLIQRKKKINLIGIFETEDKETFGAYIFVPSVKFEQENKVYLLHGKISGEYKMSENK